MTRLAPIAAVLVSLTGFALAQDDAASGPDFWAVDGLKAGSSLNVRSEPSTSAPVSVQISQGTILRNLGCEGTGASRWCQIASPDGLAISGWASGAYLVESGPPPAADALVAGTRYNATGSLPCTLADHPDITQCPFGVIRANPALASIFITLPDGDERLLEFRSGQPVAPPGTTMTFANVEDMTTVILDDGAETYTIADVVFLGD